MEMEDKSAVNLLASHSKLLIHGVLKLLIHGARVELEYTVDEELVMRVAHARTTGGFQASGPLACHLVAAGWTGGAPVTLRVHWMGGEVSELELKTLGQWITMSPRKEESR